MDKEFQQYLDELNGRIQSLPEDKQCRDCKYMFYKLVHDGRCGACHELHNKRKKIAHERQRMEDAEKSKYEHGVRGKVNKFLNKEKYEGKGGD